MQPLFLLPITPSYIPLTMMSVRLATALGALNLYAVKALPFPPKGRVRVGVTGSSDKGVSLTLELSLEHKASEWIALAWCSLNESNDHCWKENQQVNKELL